MRAQIHSNPYTHSRHTLHILIQHTTMGYVLGVFVFIYKAKYSYLNRQQFESQRITNGAKSTLSAVPPTAKRDQRESHTQRETETESERKRERMAIAGK